MGNYTILDTGYANTGASGTQETRANSGTAVELLSSNLSYNFSASADSSPNPSTYEQSEINYVGVENASVTISGVIDRRQSTYPTFVKNCQDLCSTKGLKLLYYSSSTDGYYPMFNGVGAVSYGSLQVDGVIKCLLIRCLKFNVSETEGSSLARYSLTITITKEIDA